jgi:membrane-bound lytic murein transglycosylase MltF
VTDPKSLLPALNEAEGDIAAARLIPNADNQAAAAFTDVLYHTDPVLVQQDEPPAQAGTGTEKAIKPGPGTS